MSAVSSDAKRFLMMEAERLGYDRPIITKGGHLLWVHTSTRQRVITGVRLQGRALRNARAQLRRFSGYAALPALTVSGDWRTILRNPTTLAAAEAAYRELMRAAHPGTGGSHAAALNAAIAEARRLWE